MIAVIDICGYAPVHVMTMDPMMLDGSGGGRARSRLGDGREEGGREGDGREGGQPLSGHKLRADDMGSRARILRHSCSFAGCFERTRTAAYSRYTRDTCISRPPGSWVAPHTRRSLLKVHAPWKMREPDIVSLKTHSDCVVDNGSL